MSYKKVFARKDRVAARFLAQVHSVISHAAVSAKMDSGLTQMKIAQELGVDKSVVSRILKGAGNPTIRTVGEIAAALGYRPELTLHKINPELGSNDVHMTMRGNALVMGRQQSATNKSENSAIVSGAKHPLTYECVSR